VRFCWARRPCSPSGRKTSAAAASAGSRRVQIRFRSRPGARRLRESPAHGMYTIERAMVRLRFQTGRGRPWRRRSGDRRIVTTDESPFLFSVKVPEGNYRITATLGRCAGASNTTIRTEAATSWRWTSSPRRENLSPAPSSPTCAGRRIRRRRRMRGRHRGAHVPRRRGRRPAAG